jgi:hypothetical protein
MRNRGGLKIQGVDVLDSKPELMKAARYVRKLITAVTLTLPVVFAWLKFHDVDFAPIAKDITADVIVKCTLAFYYLCWVAGLRSDTSDQELVFVQVPDWRHVFIGGTSIGFLIAIVFGILCYVNSPREFAVFLAIFLTINVLSWLYLVKIVLPPTFHESENIYQQKKKFVKLEQLRLVFNWYLCGRWQWTRFVAGAVIVALMIWMSFSYSVGRSAMQLGTHSIKLEIIISLIILLFVAVMEIWIWYMRLRVKAGLRLLDDMQYIYHFDPITKSKRSG